MEIIVSHNHLDFDGLASMVAAQRLYPRAEMVFVGGLSGNVQRFMSLHKDSLMIKRVKEIPLDRVRRVVVVDTNSPRRLGDLGSWLRKSSAEIHLYDHHPEPVEPLKATVKVTDTIGAATTLLVEKIRKSGLRLSRFEATLLALGIYEDTGSLTFTTTTVRDVRAVAYLLEQGANLGIVANFIELSFTDEQKFLFNRLLSSVQHKTINGIDVVLASARSDKQIGNLDFLTHKLGDIETFDAFFTVVEMSNRVYIVARSRTDSLDVGEVCAIFGGGGHPKASSATIKGRSLESVLEELERVLAEKTHPPIVARDIMSSPVKTIPMHLSLEEAGKIMLRYGHTGLPVLEDGRVVGVISRRDVDKGRIHGLGHSPVKGYMSRNVVSVSPETPVSELQYLLVKHDIGRLPVMENGQLIGIVSRTDILRTFHGQDYPEDHILLYNNQAATSESLSWLGKNWRDQMLKELPVQIFNILKVAGSLADELGMAVYVVGGFVRDLLLGQPNLDMDLVVEGHGPDFARALASNLGGKVRVHERFGTAMVIGPDGSRIDVATARMEYYEYPAALPTVERSNLRHDLYRRDFTINAMAIQLNSDHFGDLIDFFGGRMDLERRLVRVLYNLSFVEDPTRIIRAIRFEQRLGFQIETQTLQLIEDSIYRGFLKGLSGARIREEVSILLSEADPIPGLRRLVDLGVAAQVLPEVKFDHRIWRMLGRIPRIQDKVRLLLSEEIETKEPASNRILNKEAIYWMVLFHQIGVDKLNEVSSKYRLNRAVTNLMLLAYQAQDQLTKLGGRPGKVKMSTIDPILQVCPAEVFIFLSVLTSSRAWQNQLLSYLKLKSQARPELTGNDLINLGLKPGPQFKSILDQIRTARLDGLIETKAEELNLVKAIVAGQEEAVK
ncbi:MAG: CBS domain-containing protein [Bacillota bacterium]|jgi:tRNA nucleotidyltransferase (CCA-adding enzyme)